MKQALTIRFIDAGGETEDSINAVGWNCDKMPFNPFVNLNYGKVFHRLHCPISKEARLPIDLYSTLGKEVLGYRGDIATSKWN